MGKSGYETTIDFSEFGRSNYATEPLNGRSMKKTFDFKAPSSKGEWGGIQLREENWFYPNHYQVKIMERWYSWLSPEELTSSAKLSNLGAYSI